MPVIWFDVCLWRFKPALHTSSLAMKRDNSQESIYWKASNCLSSSWVVSLFSATLTRRVLKPSKTLLLTSANERPKLSIKSNSKNFRVRLRWRRTAKRYDIWNLASLSVLFRQDAPLRVWTPAQLWNWASMRTFVSVTHHEVVPPPIPKWESDDEVEFSRFCILV